MGITTRKTPRSLPRRKFWFDDRDRERILRRIRPKFLAAIRNMGLPLPYEPGERISTDPEPEFLDLKEMVLAKYPHARKGLPLPQKPGERITEKPSVQFFLGLHPIRISAPMYRKGAGRFLEKAEKDLASLGFDGRFRESYRKNAEMALERYFLPMTASIEGELLDQFVSILDGVRGERLWSILVTDPETREEDEAARVDLEERIASCKTTRESLAISHNAKSSIIKGFYKERKLSNEKIGDRIRTRRRREN